MRVKKVDKQLQFRTFQGKRARYQLYLTEAGAYHAFTEVTLKDALEDCGIKLGSRSPREGARELWKRGAKRHHESRKTLKIDSGAACRPAAGHAGLAAWPHKAFSNRGRGFRSGQSRLRGHGDSRHKPYTGSPT